jgi:nucleotide-binding universal stress UspA family protein
MFSKIIVALNEQPESQRALQTAIQLARPLSATLVTVSLLGDLPSYASFATIVDPTLRLTLRDDIRRHQMDLHENAANQAREAGVAATGSILEERDLRETLRFLKEQKADLLVIGLHQHDFYLSRLWNSVFDLAQDAPCSVLGVH